MKRLILTTLGAVGLALAAPAVAAAHAPTVTDNCNGLTMSFLSYEGNPPNNRVTVTIDGTVQVFDFGTNLTQTIGWSPTAAHTWSVVLDANRIQGHPTLWDRTFNGTEPACQTSTTTTSTTTTSTEPPDSPTSTTVTPTTTTTSTAPSSTTTTTAPQSPSTTVEQMPPGIVTPTTAISTDSSPPSSASPATTSPTAPAEPLDRLPDTGRALGWWVGAALIAIALGVAAVLGTRRPRVDLAGPPPIGRTMNNATVTVLVVGAVSGFALLVLLTIRDYRNKP